MTVQLPDDVVGEWRDGYESRSLDHVYGSGVIENYVVRIARDRRGAGKHRHPAPPQLSYCALRAAFDQVGLLPRQVWADRILYGARETAGPHPDKALPGIR